MIILMDAPMSAPSLHHYLSIIPDFRQSWKVKNQLSDILFLFICAVICSFEGWDEIEDFGHSKLNFLRQYGNFTGGIPSHDTLGESDDIDQCRASSNSVCRMDESVS